jgi:hypothetical protein
MHFIIAKPIFIGKTIQLLAKLNNWADWLANSAVTMGCLPGTTIVIIMVSIAVVDRSLAPCIIKEVFRLDTIRTIVVRRMVFVTKAFSKILLYINSVAFVAKHYLRLKAFIIAMVDKSYQLLG